MNKKRAKYIIVPFVALLSFGFVVNVFNKDKEVSFSENRALQQRPTMESFKNGTFTKEYDKYYSDQFAFREELMTLYDKFKVAFGSNKVKNYYVLDDNWIMPTPTKRLSDKKILDASNKIKSLIDESYSKKKDFYYVSTPHKESLVSHLYPKSIRSASKAVENRDKFENNLKNTNIKFINMYEYFKKSFSSEDMEKMYFKTDHHWNGIGAFEGFKYMVDKMNLSSNIDWNDYSKSTLNKGTFLGSYNKNLNKLVDEKEDIPYIHKKDTSGYKYYKFDGNKDIEVKVDEVIATRRNESDILYGGAYVFGNACNILKIKNDDAPVDKKIIVFRDSYQSPMTWLFADMFKEVQLVDVRHTQDLNMSAKDMIEKSDSDIVMFMYNDADFDEMIKGIN